MTATTPRGLLWPVPDALDDPPTERPGRMCWQCRRKFLEADFANGRCMTCVSTEQRNTTVRLAFRVLRGGAYIGTLTGPANRRRSVWGLLARSVERQAELEGISCSIAETDTESWGSGWPR